MESHIFCGPDVPEAVTMVSSPVLDRVGVSAVCVGWSTASSVPSAKTWFHAAMYCARKRPAAT